MNSLLEFFDAYGQFTIPFVFILIAISAMLIGNYLSPKQTIRREFKKNRKRAINSIKENEYAKIIGIAKHVLEPLVAPLSGRQCVYYHVIVEVKGDKRWRRIINDVKSQDFFVETTTEKAIVKSASIQKSTSKCYLVKDYKENSGFRNDAPQKLEAYLKQHNKKSTGLLGINKTVRYTEGVIELNEKIGVKGIAKWKTINEPIEGYSCSRILTLEGSKKEKLLITDEPKALLRVDNRLQ